jgi:hypothetical protein
VAALSLTAGTEPHAKAADAMTSEVMVCECCAAHDAAMNTTAPNTALRRLLLLDGITGLVSIVGWLVQPERWAGWLGVEAGTVRLLALTLCLYVSWIAALLVSHSVTRARALVWANAGYAVACVTTVLWAVATSSLTTIGVVNAAGHALFVGWLTVAQHRALAKLDDALGAAR